MNETDTTSEMSHGREAHVGSGAWLGSSGLNKRSLDAIQVGNKSLLCGHPRGVFVRQGLVALTVHLALWNVLILPQDGFAGEKLLGGNEWTKPIERKEHVGTAFSVKGSEMWSGRDLRNSDAKPSNGFFVSLVSVGENPDETGDNRTANHKHCIKHKRGITHILYWPFMFLLFGVFYWGTYAVAGRFFMVPNRHSEPRAKRVGSSNSLDS